MSCRWGRSLCGIAKRPENEQLRTLKIARDKAYTFVAALLRRSKNRTAANLDHYAKRSGVEPGYWYIQYLCYLWAGASPLIVFLIAIRGRKSLTWIGVALSIIVSHSLIPHKEYRFIFPASAILLIVAALGSADVIGKLQAKMGEGIARYLTICGVAFWLLTSLSLAFAPRFSDNWFRSRQILESALWLHGQSGLCVLLIYDDGWASTGGYTYLHRNIPMYNP